MKRHALTDEQWDLVRPLIPRSNARTGRPARDPRLIRLAMIKRYLKLLFGDRA